MILWFIDCLRQSCGRKARAEANGREPRNDCKSRSLISNTDLPDILRNFSSKTSDGGIDVRLCIEMKPKIMTLVEHRYHFNTSNAPESIRSNVKLAKTLLRDMKFIYPVGTAPVGPRLKDTDPISSIGGPGWW